MIADPETTFHLHRRYNMRPFRRFAITVTFDPKNPLGYRVIDHDSTVADVPFMTAFVAHMKKPQKVWSGDIEHGIAYTTHEPAQPGTKDFYKTAIRNVPQTAVMPYARKS